MTDMHIGYQWYRPA